MTKTKMKMLRVVKNLAKFQFSLGQVVMVNNTGGYFFTGGKRYGKSRERVNGYYQKVIQKMVDCGHIITESEYRKLKHHGKN